MTATRSYDLTGSVLGGVAVIGGVPVTLRCRQVEATELGVQY